MGLAVTRRWAEWKINENPRASGGRWVAEAFCRSKVANYISSGCFVRTLVPTFHLPLRSGSGSFMQSTMKHRNTVTADWTALKEKYLTCFVVRSTNLGALREAVKGLFGLGVSRQMLVRWAVQAGYSAVSVRSLLSRILCSMGLRTRGAGAGRKPSADALALLAYARERYGDRYLKILRAACRAGRPGAHTDPTSEGPSARRFKVIVVPQLAAGGEPPADAGFASQEANSPTRV